MSKKNNELINNFRISEKELQNNYELYKGGGLLFKSKKKSDPNTTIYTIKTSDDLLQFLGENNKINSIKKLSNKSSLEKKTIEDHKTNFKNLIDRIRLQKIVGYKINDNLYEYKDHYNNIWRFSSVGLAMAVVFSGVLTSGATIPAISTLGLVISWFYSKYALYDEMQKVLIILLYNTLHMKRNVIKIKSIIESRNPKNPSETDEEYIKRIDDYILKEISPFFTSFKKQVESFLHCLFNFAGPVAAQEFILFIHFEQLTTDKKTLHDINITDILDKPKHKSLFKTKIKKFFKNMKDMFVVEEKYRIMIREGNICLSIFTLLISDILIYAINSNAIGTNQITLDIIDKEEKSISNKFPDSDGKDESESKLSSVYEEPHIKKLDKMKPLPL